MKPGLLFKGNKNWCLVIIRGESSKIKTRSAYLHMSEFWSEKLDTISFAKMSMCK